jgi:hypothetical protein
MSPQPQVASLDKPSPLTAFLAILFAFLGISDLTAVSTTSAVTDAYWASQTPVRLVFLFVVTGYTYMFKKGGIFGPKLGVTGYQTGPGEQLKNGLVFTWGFLELGLWFWVSSFQWTFLGFVC